MIKEERLRLVRQVLPARWWEAEYEELFTPDMRLELPFVPPGMAQVMTGERLAAHIAWLRRTVLDWSSDTERCDGPRAEDGSIFFITYTVRGRVNWGGFESDYDNRCCARVTFSGTRICGVKLWSNPLKYLYAAKRNVPLFSVDLSHPAVVTARMPAPAPAPEYSYTPEEARAENIRRFLSTVRGYSGVPLTGEGFRRFVWFCPPDMKESYPPEEEPLMEKWSSLSGLQRYIMPDAVCYETDDPRALYFETGVYGTSSWIGNNSCGGYCNRYVKFLQLDERGYAIRYDEYLNPVGKMNGVNRPLPSFPWLY